MTKPFRHLTIDRVFLSLDDLLTKRLTSLGAFPYGVFVQEELTELRDNIGALPAAAKSKPLAKDLGALDKNHDGFGGAMFHQVESYLAAPDTTTAQREALETLHDVFGNRNALTAKYDAEAKAASEKRARLPELLPLLQLFPIAGGKTLADWAEAHIAAGEEIGRALSDRADIGDRALAAQYRSQAISALNNSRRELAKARKKNPALPESLDEEIFAFCDSREAESTAEAEVEKKAEAQRKLEAPGKKAEVLAKRLADKRSFAAETARRAQQAQKAAEDAQKEADDAAHELDKADKEAQAPATPPAPKPTKPVGA